MSTLGFQKCPPGRKILEENKRSQPFDMDIIKLLEEYLTDYPTSIIKLSEDMGISYPSVFNFLKGKSKPNTKTRAQIMKFLKDKNELNR